MDAFWLSSDGGASQSSSSDAAADDPLLVPSQHRLSDTVSASIDRLYHRLVDDDEEPPPPPPDQHRRPMVGSVANLCSATLGAGILALPFAMYQAGLVAGTALLVGTALLTICSIDSLVEACQYYRVHTYEGLATTIGPWTRKSVEVSMMVFCAGTAVAYLMAVGDIGAHVWFHNRNLSMMVVWVTVLLPLSLLRTMQSLQWASGIGMSAIGTLIFSAYVHYVTNDSSHPTAHHYHFTTNILWPSNGILSILTACPVVLFAFSCQVNVCAIFHELEGDTTTTPPAKLKRMKGIARASVAICACLYGATAFVVLAEYGTTVQANLLSCYTDHTSIMTVAMVCMGLALLLAFPLNIFPARTTLMGLLESLPPPATHVPNETLTAALLSDAESPDPNPGDEGEGSIMGPHHRRRSVVVPPSEQHPAASTDDWKRHVVVTLFLSGIVLALALLVPNISVVFGLLGGTTSSWLGFCVPGWLGIRLCGAADQNEGEDEEPQRSRKKKIVSWLLLIFGIAVGSLTTAVTIYDTIQNS